MLYYLDYICPIVCLVICILHSVIESFLASKQSKKIDKLCEKCGHVLISDEEHICVKDSFGNLRSISYSELIEYADIALKAYFDSLGNKNGD